MCGVGGGRQELGEGPGEQVHASRKEGEQGTAPAASPTLRSWEAVGKSFSIPAPQFLCLTNPEGGRRWNQRDDWMWKHERQALPSTHWLRDFGQVIGCIHTSLLNRRPLSLSLLAGHPGVGLGSHCPSSPPPPASPSWGGNKPE